MQHRLIPHRSRFLRLEYKKPWVAGNYTEFETLQTQDIYESISNEIANYDQNEMIEVITQAMSNEDVLQHFLAVDNVYTDSEFCNNNVFV